MARGNELRFTLGMVRSALLQVITESEPDSTSVAQRRVKASLLIIDASIEEYDACKERLPKEVKLVAKTANGMDGGSDRAGNDREWWAKLREYDDDSGGYDGEPDWQARLDDYADFRDVEDEFDGRELLC